VITASALPRVAACPGSVALSKAHTQNQNTADGTVRHAAVEEAVLEGRLDDIPAKVREFIDEGAVVTPEVVVYYNWRTGAARQTGRGESARAYDVGEDEIPGTIDLLIVGRRLVVVDYKGHEDVGTPEEHEQIMLYAVAAARIHGFTEVTVVVAYIGAGVEDARVVPVVVDCLELAASRAKLTRIMEAAEAQSRKAVPDVHESRHCKYCPSKSVCPSKVGLLVQVATKGLAVIGDTTMTTERAAEAYREIERIEQLVKDARKRLEVYVDEQGPIDLGNGRAFGRYRRPGNEKVNGAIAVQAIRDALPLDAEAFIEAATERTTSKTAIERAAKALYPARGMPTKVTRAVLARARELGGITAADTFPLGEFAVDRQQAVEKEAIDTDAVDRLLTAAG